MSIITETTLLKIAAATNGVVIDYSVDDVLFTTPGVQIFVASAGSIKYDDDAGNTAQTISSVPAGFITPWRVTRIYKIGTDAVLVAVY